MTDSAQQKSILIVGLGNPGDKYRSTRHNAGWIWLDSVFDAHDYVHDKYGNYDYTTLSEDGRQIILIKPQTFMNNSGKAVKHALDHFGIDLNNLLVVHDDVDIEIGDYKLSNSRGSGGHNGIKSIHQSLGSNEYNRLRLGVRPVGVSQTVKADTYVLKKLSKEELDLITKLDRAQVLNNI